MLPGAGWAFLARAGPWEWVVFPRRALRIRVPRQRATPPDIRTRSTLVIRGRPGSSGQPRPYRRDCLVMGLAVGVTGVTFGVLADAAGFDLLRVIAMSALMFTGASQFAVVGVINDGGTGGAAVGSALLLAARNALYGPVVRRALPASAFARLGGAHFVVDETTGMAAAQTRRRDAAGAFWLAGATLWLSWNLGSVTGALLGTVMGAPETWGLDAAFPAIFAALLTGHLRTAAGRTAAVVAGTIALGSVPFTASGIPILLSVLALPPALYVRARRRRLSDPENRPGPAP